MTTTLNYSENDLMVVHPGEAAFESGGIVIQTLLGSCVSVVAINKEKNSGGLCHFLLTKSTRDVDEQKQLRYAEFAIPWLMTSVENVDALDTFDFYLFGGSHLFDEQNQISIGKDNIDYAERWLESKGVELKGRDVGGDYCRKIMIAASDR